MICTFFPSEACIEACAQRTQAWSGAVRLAGMRMAAFSTATNSMPNASRCARSAGAKRAGSASTV